MFRQGTEDKCGCSTSVVGRIPLQDTSTIIVGQSRGAIGHLVMLTMRSMGGQTLCNGAAVVVIMLTAQEARDNDEAYPTTILVPCTEPTALGEQRTMCARALCKGFYKPLVVLIPLFTLLYTFS
jgi:hypothetical protein